MADQGFYTSDAGKKVVDHLTEASNTSEIGAREKSLAEANDLMKDNNITTHSRSSDSILQELTDNGTIGNLMVMELGDSEKSFDEIEKMSREQSVRGLVAEKAYDEFYKIDGAGDKTKQDLKISPDEIEVYAKEISLEIASESVIDKTADGTISREMQRDRFSFEPTELSDQLPESSFERSRTVNPDEAFSFTPDELTPSLERSIHPDSYSNRHGNRHGNRHNRSSHQFSFDPSELKGQVSESIECDEKEPSVRGAIADQFSFEPEKLKTQVSESIDCDEKDPAVTAASSDRFSFEPNELKNDLDTSESNIETKLEEPSTNKDVPASQKDVTKPDPLEAPGGRQFELLEDGSARYKVQSGDTVWHVAQEVLQKRLERTPSNQEIMGLTNEISKASGLTTNGRNPDLIYPYGGPSPVNSSGDVLVIPPAAKVEDKKKEESSKETEEKERPDAPSEVDLDRVMQRENKNHIAEQENKPSDGNQEGKTRNDNRDREIDLVEILQLDKYAFDSTKEPKAVDAVTAIQTMTATGSDGNLLLKLGFANRVMDNPNVPKEDLQKLVNMSVLVDVDYPLPGEPSTKTSLARELLKENGGSFEFSKDFLEGVSKSSNPKIIDEQKQALKLLADNMPLYTDGDTISLREIRAFTGVDRDFLNKVKDDSAFSTEQKSAMNFFSDNFDYFSPEDSRLELQEAIAYIERLTKDPQKMQELKEYEQSQQRSQTQPHRGKR